MYEKGLRSGERDGYGRTFTLLAYKSVIVVRAEWQGAPSCIRRISLLHKWPSVWYKMHNSQFKFLPEFWLKKNGIIRWKTKLDLLYTFAIRFASSMFNRPPRHASLNHFVLILNVTTKARRQYHVKQAGRFVERIWNTSDNGKKTSLRNIYVKMLVLHITFVVITQNSLGRRWRDLQPSQRPLHLLR